MPYPGVDPAVWLSVSGLCPGEEVVEGEPEDCWDEVETGGTDSTFPASTATSFAGPWNIYCLGLKKFISHLFFSKFSQIWPKL